MNKKRIIARLDIKNEFVIKGIHLEGLRRIGDPNLLAKKYYNDGIDEIIFMDAVAAYYDRNSLSHIIDKAAQDIFVPITVGGGIRNKEDIQKALNSGADKVAINTQAVRNPAFIEEAAKNIGSQCIVSSIVVKNNNKKWEIYTDNGREPTGIDAVEWAVKMEECGAGEIMITSVDMEGTKKGYDLEIIDEISLKVHVPVIVSGGVGTINHVKELFDTTKADGSVLASILHYNITNVKELKKELSNSKIQVRL